MLKIAICTVALMAIVLLYALLRPRLRQTALFKPIYDRLEPLEQLLWSRSRTLLLARLIWLPGFLLSLHDLALPAIGVIDWTPISTGVLLELGVPENLHAAALILFTTLLTRAFESLRKVTLGPVEKQP